MLAGSGEKKVTLGPGDELRRPDRACELHDDGAQTTRFYGITGHGADGRVFPPADVPAVDFPQIVVWAAKNWGARAIIEGGPSAANYARAAIQHRSDPEEATVYTHLGWRKLPGYGWCYLSNGTVLSAAGPVDGVTVKVRRQGHQYRAACTAGGVGRRSHGDGAIPRPRSIPAYVPLLAATVRAALCEMLPASSVLWLVGPTGVGKTELAAACARFYGPAFEGKSLPGWQGTANALEYGAFVHKDTIHLLDDYKPEGSLRDQQDLRSKAERLIRGAGNGQARDRLGRDGRLMPTYDPRGLSLVTGEDTPEGLTHRQVDRADVSAGDVNLEALTTVQTGEGRVVPSQAMAAFLQDTAGRFDKERAEFPRTCFVTATSSRAPRRMAEHRTPWPSSRRRCGSGFALARVAGRSTKRPQRHCCGTA